MKKTPLHAVHKELGAKMVPFGGWDMPVQYTGIISEHLATRTKAGLFDVSHMGEILVEGDASAILTFLEKVTCNTIEGLVDGQVQYNAVVNSMGGLVDDITVYKISSEKYFICSNASNYEAVTKHFNDNNTDPKVKITNDSENWHQLALQGPEANSILEDYLSLDLKPLGYYRFAFYDFNHEKILVSRTGYTGEDGFEIYTSIPTGIKIWKELLEQYKGLGLVPVGLGARDTLRIEAKYPLYGHELLEDRSPIVSGLSWIVKEKKKPFLAYDKIMHDKKMGAYARIVGIRLLEPGVMREDFPIYSQDGVAIGKTTSGTHSPSRKESIGLALIKKEFIQDGQEISVEIRGQKKKAIIHTGKFIEGSVRTNK
jgi:aminomethyltransferase